MTCPVYIGVDINVTGEIGYITTLPENMPPHLLVIEGTFDGEVADGVITIPDDGSEAAALVLAQTEPVGLGWTFKAAS